MTIMVPTRPAALPVCRVWLIPGPTSAAEASGQAQAAIGARDVPVDGDVAVLAIRELVTNAIRHAMAEAVTAGIRQARGEFRIDVHDIAGERRT
jgi:nitrate/nitrite-specific signal transduction histidine kinase